MHEQLQASWFEAYSGIPLLGIPNEVLDNKVDEFQEFESG